MMRIVSKIWRLLPFQARLRIIRLTQPKFTVSVVAMILNDRKEVLILDHYIRPGASWGLPGGFIESDEDPEAAIRREINEETTLDLSNVSLIRIRTVRKHIEILFLADSIGTVSLESAEIRDFGWFSKDSLPDGISVKQRNLVKHMFESHIT